MLLPSENTLFKIAALGFGLICGIAIIAFMEQINIYLHPVPELSDMQSEDFETFYTNNHIYLIGSLISHAAGSFFAGAIPLYFKPDVRPIHAVFIALILIVLSSFNLYSVNYPAWYWIANLILYVPLVLTGAIFAKKINSNQ